MYNNRYGTGTNQSEWMPGSWRPLVLPDVISLGVRTWRILGGEKGPREGVMWRGWSSGHFPTSTEDFYSLLF